MEEKSGIEKQKYYLKLSNEEANQITKESLQTALIQLMNEKDYKEISITELTKRAGTSRTAFYRNYKAKEDIMMEICDDICKELEAYKKEMNFFANPKEWFLGLFESVNENRKLYDMLEKADLQDKTQYEFSIWTEEYSRNDYEHYYYRLAMDKAFWFIFWEWVKNGFKESPEEMAEINAKLYHAMTNLA